MAYIALGQYYTVTMDATISTSSPYGSFVKTGRGGAGNFNWNDDAKRKEQQQHQSDIEAQHLTSQTSLPVDTGKRSNAYIHTGRGGVGNFAQETNLPSDLESGPKELLSQYSKVVIRPPTFAGRGGAGNFDVITEDAATLEQRKDDASHEKWLAGHIQEAVDKDLKRPGQVYLPGSDGRENRR